VNAGQKNPANQNHYQELCMKRSILITMLSVMLALPAACLAGDDQLFDKLDTNKDGTLSKEELTKNDLVIVPRKDGKKQVQSRDAAGDSKQSQAMTAEDKKKLLDSIDQDKNGSISRKEWNRSSPDGFVLWRF
jgi:hypothetical protein